MSVTIVVPEPLAGQLQLAARKQQVGVDSLALDLLSSSLDEESRYTTTGSRRRWLIRKSASGGLTPEESRELEELQALADQELEMLDAQRLQEVERMRREVLAALGTEPPRP